MYIITGEIFIGLLTDLYVQSGDDVEAEISNYGTPDYDEEFRTARQTVATFAITIKNLAIEKNLPSASFQTSHDLRKNNYGLLHSTFDSIGMSLHEHNIDPSITSADDMKFALMSALEGDLLILKHYVGRSPEDEHRASEYEMRRTAAHETVVEFLKKCFD